MEIPQNKLTRKILLTLKPLLEFLGYRVGIPPVEKFRVMDVYTNEQGVEMLEVCQLNGKGMWEIQHIPSSEMKHTPESNS